MEHFVFLMFTSITSCMGHKRIDYFTFYCRCRENTSKVFVCIIHGKYISCMKVYLTMFSNFTTIAQSVKFSSMLSKHKLELFNCTNFENFFKTKVYRASHGTRIHNKCYICGKIFKNNNTLTKHYVN